jgi:hypothetical protein
MPTATWLPIDEGTTPYAAAPRGCGATAATTTTTTTTVAATTTTTTGGGGGGLPFPFEDRHQQCARNTHASAGAALQPGKPGSGRSRQQVQEVELMEQLG